MTFSPSSSDHIKFEYISDIFKSSYPILASSCENAYSLFGVSWLKKFLRDVETLYSKIDITTDNLPLRNAIEAYSEFCADALRHQVFFERNGKYMNTSASDCLDSFYRNEEHMTKRYLPGLWLSHYLWPHHYNMLQNFSSRITQFIGNSQGLFYEVGVGCGMYSKTILEKIPGISGVGIDISEFSLHFTQSVVSSFGYSDRYSILNHDIYDRLDVQANFLVCQEVLEHLDDPLTFCKALFDMVLPGGHAYITAALNAAHSDHIYLFSNPLQVEDMLRASGFIPLGFQEEFAHGQKPRSLTPSIAGFYCIKP